MFAIICNEFGSADVLRWEEVAIPRPQASEVLIKVAAAGVNRADILQRQGKYPPPEGASTILGLEISGEIIELGSSNPRWKLGDKVCALLSGGGYAEYVAVPAGHCLPVPSTLALSDAAALPEAVATVWSNLFETGGLISGEAAFIHGGGSGIGTMAIQMARLQGAKAFVTVGSEEKAEACRKLGADFVINYKMQDFVEQTMGATNNQGVNVVLDMIGGDYVNRNLQILATFGRHISIATQQGKMASLDVGLIMRKRLMITGSTLRGRPMEEKVRLIGEIEKNIWPWVIEGRLKPLIYSRYPIKNAAEAHKMMESGKHFGKMILEVAF